MSTPAPHNQSPLHTASGIYDDIELYPKYLVIRHRDILSRLREQAEILDLQDIESVKISPKRYGHNNWLEMKIISRNHSPIDVCYKPEERTKMRELHNLLIELRIH